MALAIAPRGVRSDQLRDLIRRAVDQGWDVYPNGGGHLSAVNPTTGGLVILSTTTTGAGRALANTRAAFARAGLDLRPRSEVRRAQRQEARMQVRNATREEVPPVQVTDRHPFLDSGTTRPDAIGRADRVCATCGGVAKAPRHRVDREEDLVLVTVHDNGSTTVAELDPEGAALEDAAVEESRHRLEDVHLEDQEPRQLPRPSTFHVVQAAPEDFPLATALDQLDTALAPGLDALERAGKVDAADLVRAELVRTPLEEELLALYRRVMSGA